MHVKYVKLRTQHCQIYRWKQNESIQSSVEFICEASSTLKTE